jgi:hypothetical protein
LGVKELQKEFGIDWEILSGTKVLWGRDERSKALEIEERMASGGIGTRSMVLKVCNIKTF